MVNEAKEILAEGVREALKRSPIVAMLILEIGVLIYFGWALMSGSAEERAELRARNAELTRQLIVCYQHGNRQKTNAEKMAAASVQSDIAK